MPSDNRRSAIALLAELWELSPDVRLGQLMSHLGLLGENYFGEGLGYIDDDELMGVMVRHREELLARLQGISDQPPPIGTTISVSGSCTLSADLGRTG
ncbi:MAG: hypothetical protein B7Z73_10740 [Planctomycetia bacterium 21-64-5]|nr:MAG: hypothetical protein B7Z73_10740 [Planctomycetia bacterium 21-64-5]HQU44901.1 hypothetical protein [Pirellulales bacterium]